MKVHITWEIDVTEHYRVTVDTVDLPDLVVEALEAGLLFDEVKAGELGHASIEAHDELRDWYTDHEEGPYDDAVTRRDLTGLRAL